MSLELSSSEKEYLNVTDLKQYAFCPRIPYFQHILGYEERVTESMLEGRVSEEEFEKREKRRKKFAKKLEAEEKVFNIPLCSPKLELMGVVDCILIRGSEIIPVEFKASKKPKKLKENHLIQLAAYSILAEEFYGKIVRKAMIYYEKTDEFMEIRITKEAKQRVLKLLEKLKEMLKEENLPEVNQPKSKCANCGYRKICLP